jgi:hypothetical protein
LITQPWVLGLLVVWPLCNQLGSRFHQRVFYDRLAASITYAAMLIATGFAAVTLYRVQSSNGHAGRRVAVISLLVCLLTWTLVAAGYVFEAYVD